MEEVGAEEPNHGFEVPGPMEEDTEEFCALKMEVCWPKAIRSQYKLYVVKLNSKIEIEFLFYLCTLQSLSDAANAAIRCQYDA